MAFPGLLPFASSRTHGIAQHVSSTGLVNSKLQIYSLVLLFLETFFGLNSRWFRSSRIILLLVLASKQGLSVPSLISRCPSGSPL